MGACLSKKKGSSTSSHSQGNGVTVNASKPPTQPEVNPKKKTVQEKQDAQVVVKGKGGDECQVKKEIFIIKHRKSHDDRERNSKTPPFADESMGNKIAPSTPKMGMGTVGVRTSSCTKEEVDAILIQCGRLSRSSSGKAASSSSASGERGRKYSGSKTSYDFDHCDKDAISADDDHKRANATDNSEECDADKSHHHQHRQRHRQSPSQGRRRTPSRESEREQQQRSSSRERRVSRSPGRRSSETNANANANASNNTSSRPGKMVSVPATVSSLVMDKSNNGESAAATGIKRITVKRNVGDGGSRSAASPRSQSPARAEQSLSRNNSLRKAEQSPYRRNPLSDLDPNSLAYPQSNTNNVQNKPHKEIQPEESIQKPNVDTVNDNNKNRSSSSSRAAMGKKGVSVNCKRKEQQEEEIKVLLSSVPDNAVVKTVVPSGVDNNLKPQTLTRSRSSRRSRDLDINPEALLNPTQSYTSLLLEDIHNFHQKCTQPPSISLPACLTKACSILEAVADLNSTTSSNFSEDRRSPPTYQSNSSRNEYNHYGKRVQDTKDPFVESEVVVCDDVMEPSLHKYVTVKRGGSLCGVDMEDQESSGSNSFIVSSGQQHWAISSSSSGEPSSADSTDCWTSRSNSREEGQKSSLGLEASLSSDMAEATRKKTLNSKGRECDHQHSGGIGRGRLGSSKGIHTLPVVTAAAST
ncbi:uncharacterized protein At1g65710-like [Gastrolobium bilobum]|uniref:uncharacterized protein At1g65710-like n=1 Tax=Gastrolobium bilobum TaxID=150636 RepID=UPI002AAF4FB6|nr:uncharacterized protein At1g65710-like [Gastrolobium bilobum]